MSIFYLERDGVDAGQRRIHPLLRFAVLDRDGFVCRYCGAEATEVDHTRPWARGGETLPFNLAAACRSCNLAKGDRTPEEWRRDLRAERLTRVGRRVGDSRLRTGPPHLRRRRFGRNTG